MRHERPSGELDRRYDEIYERYGRLLEQEHTGEYVAISADGRTVLGPTMHEAAEKAAQQFGPGSFLYKIGERAVGRWR
jgi:hypothetical protein